MLHKNDFRSIWELAHLWAEQDPAITDPENLPEAVTDKLQKLIWGKGGGFHYGSQSGGAFLTKAFVGSRKMRARLVTFKIQMAGNFCDAEAA